VETTRFSPLRIYEGLNSGNARRASPEVGLLPVVGEARRFKKEDISIYTPLTLSHE
jgi:hypothetical protein